MPAIDDYASNATGLTSPARKGFDITKHDTNELAHITRGLLAYTTAGKAVVVTADNDTVTVYLALGAVVPIAARIVKDTGTDAVGITGLY